MTGYRIQSRFWLLLYYFKYVITDETLARFWEVRSLCVNEYLGHCTLAILQIWSSVTIIISRRHLRQILWQSENAISSYRLIGVSNHRQTLFTVSKIRQWEIQQELPLSWKKRKTEVHTQLTRYYFSFSSKQKRQEINAPLDSRHTVTRTTRSFSVLFQSVRAPSKQAVDVCFENINFLNQTSSSHFLALLSISFSS